MKDKIEVKEGEGKSQEWITQLKTPEKSSQASKDQSISIAELSQKLIDLHNLI